MTAGSTRSTGGEGVHLRPSWRGHWRRGPRGPVKVRRRQLEVDVGTGAGGREAYLWEKVRAQLGSWRAVGARPEVLRWIRMGVPVVWERGPPPPFRGKPYPLKEEERKWFFGGGDR